MNRREKPASTAINTNNNPANSPTSTLRETLYLTFARTRSRRSMNGLKRSGRFPWLCQLKARGYKSTTVWQQLRIRANSTGASRRLKLT